MRIYVASSWCNQIQPEIVKLLREQGYDVYDFKNPAPENSGFHWSEIDPEWQAWTAIQLKNGLKHELARKGFYSDMTALEDCDVCVLVLPAGRSAHLEAGWVIGAEKPTVILLTDGCKPELMYKMAHYLCADTDELLASLVEIKQDLRRCRICGCTDDNACMGGCYWVEDDLCSSCVSARTTC